MSEGKLVYETPIAPPTSRPSGGTCRALMPTVAAAPYPYDFDPAHAALVVIDMQRDFVEPGGFGAALGNDVRPLQAIGRRCVGC